MAARARGPRWLREVAQQALLFPATRAVAQPTVIGAEDLIHAPQPAILAPNHESDIDTPLVLLSLPHAWRTRTVVGAAWTASTASAATRSPRGFWINTFPFDRGGGQRRGLAAAAAHLRDGRNVLLFPQGTRGAGPGGLPRRRRRARADRRRADHPGPHRGHRARDAQGPRPQPPRQAPRSPSPARCTRARARRRTELTERLHDAIETEHGRRGGDRARRARGADHQPGQGPVRRARRDQARPRALLRRGRRAAAAHDGRAPGADAALPAGRERQVVLPEARARQRAGLAADHDGRDRQRHAVARAGGRRRRARRRGRSTSPASASTSGRTWPRTPRTPTSCAWTSIPRPGPGSPRRARPRRSSRRCSTSTASPSFPKTTGNRGLHVYVRLEPRHVS